MLESPLDLADGADGRLDALGVGLPELREFRLIHVAELLPEIGERGLELFAVRGLVQDPAQKGDGRRRRALGRKCADPEIVLDVVAALLQGRYLRQRLRALTPEQGKGPRLAGLDLRDAGRH